MRKGTKHSSETRLKMSLAKKGSYIADKNHLWKGGKTATEKRRKYKRSKVVSCEHCSMFFSHIKGDGNPKNCNNCKKTLCICSYCLKDFFIKTKDHKDGRGLYCSINCSREHRKFVYASGEKHPRWVGGVKNIKSYGQPYKMAYRARKVNATGSYSNKEWQALKEKFSFMCLCCKKSEPEIKITADHIIPLSKGGDNTILNIQPLCHSCNSRKHDKFINYIEQYVVSGN